MICSFQCDKCNYRLIDLEIPDPDYKPSCDNCGYEVMFIKNRPPNMNLKTGDLPGAGFEGSFQPAFNTRVNSKREAMAHLAELNRAEKDKAIEAGRPFKEFTWQPEMSKQEKEWNEMRKELGSKAVNKQLSEKHEEALVKDLDTRLESKWSELADSAGL